MPPKMMTQSACQHTVAPRGRGTGGRVGRGARRTREPVKRNDVNASEHTFRWSWLIKEHDMRH
nr:hypothetical protein [Tanacetum cinerariifolium]